MTFLLTMSILVYLWHDITNVCTDRPKLLLFTNNPKPFVYSQTFFKWLDTCMAMYATSILINELLHVVIYVQLFLMTLKVKVLAYAMIAHFY